jgi:hypothetical protein
MTGHSLSLGALGALGALGGVSLGAAEPAHGPGAADFDAGQTRIAEVYEYLTSTGWRQVSPQRFAELEQAFREAGDDASVTSKLRYGSVPEVVGEVRWATRSLTDRFWFRTNAAQWALYTKEEVRGDPRQGAVGCKESSDRWRYCKIVKQWRRGGPAVWSYLEPSGFVPPEFIRKPQTRMALYLVLGAAGFFGWRVWQGRAS